MPRTRSTLLGLRRTRCAWPGLRSAGPSTSSTARALTRYAVGWRQCSDGPATRRRCCSAPPGGSSGSTAELLATPIAMRLSPPSMRGASRARRGWPSRGGRTLGGTVDPAPERDRRAARRGRAADRAGWATGRPRAQRALVVSCLAPISRELDMHWLFLACRVAQYLWDADAWDALSGRILDLVRDAGVLSLLPMAAAHESAGSCSPAISRPHRRSSWSRTRSMRR